MSSERKPLKPVTVRGGLSFSAAKPLSTTIDRDKAIKAVALLGIDYPGMRPKLQVEVGDRVAAGDTLFVDRKDDLVCHVAPLSGAVFSIDFGPKRTLSSIVVRATGESSAPTDAPAGDLPNDTSSESVRSALLSRGFWPAFRARPFGLVPPSSQAPTAIFVSAIDLAPGAVPPGPVIAEQQDAWERGLSVLATLSDGLVYVCLDASSRVSVPENVSVRSARFGGSYQAGLASTHIHRLAPSDPDRPVWTIGFQDVLAIGTLFLTGRYSANRTVALTGGQVGRPRLVEAPLGASLRDLLDGELTGHSPREQQIRILSGTAVAGRDSAFLSRYDTQVTTMARRAPAKRPSWVDQLPFFGIQTSSPLVPNAAMDGALPAAVLAVPFMRALSVGDAQAAKRLGAMDLVEEDVAVLNHVCTSGADYRALLRAVLTELAEDAA